MTGRYTNYVIWVVFYPCDPCESVNEKQYHASNKDQALVDVYDTLMAGGYAVMTINNQSFTIRTKQDFWLLDLD